ncbi:MAG TPA: hypothetical protein VN914_14545 [Polyangia bacterium]|nr:hypothetical protein [Polyangia bacterium]
MSLARTSAAVLLAASVAANGVLVRALTHRAKPPAATEPAPRPPAAPAVFAPSEGPGELAGCADQIHGLERELAGRSEALRGLLAPQALFERGEANPAAEGLMASIIVQALGPLGSQAHRLECRDVACQASFTAAAAVPDEAIAQALERHVGFQTWSHAFDLSEPRPVDAPGGLVQRRVYFKIDGPHPVVAATVKPPPSAQKGRR